MHEQFMYQALKQAQKGQGRCSPNPSVGAVAVQNNAIIAQSYHQGAGFSHAEQLLFTQFPANTKDVSIYVTLEPCNHFGRTPPCVDAIILHNIKRVVYAYKDPNPIVANNNTPEILRAAGVDVVFLPLPEISEFYRSYAFWHQAKMPWLTLKMAQSINGKIAGFKGERKHITHDIANQWTHHQRQMNDAILTSANTICNDNPYMNVRHNDEVEYKPLIILDKDLMLDQKSLHIFDAQYQGIIFYDINKKPTFKHKNYEYIGVQCSKIGLNLTEILKISGQKGYHSLWGEVGARLFTSIHQQQLVQETYILVSPEMIEHNGMDLWENMSLLNPFKQETHVLGSDACFRYIWQEF